jgi:hypothetical protein
MGLGTGRCHQAPKSTERIKLVRKEAAQLWGLIDGM